MLARLAALFTGRDTRERLQSLERAVRKLHEAGRDQATTLQARLDELARALAEQPTSKDLRELRQAVRSVASLSDYRHQFEVVEQIATSGKPIIVGPWTGEVGFELLYWIPFVEWVRRHWSIPAERLTIVSRGGVASWYGWPGAAYADAFDYVTPAEFREAVAAEKRKQRRQGVFDERLLERALQGRSRADVEVLHPGLMYKWFEPYWRDDAGYARLDQFTVRRLLAPPHDARPAGLPDEYVAVRFYFSECFPNSEDNRAFARRVVSALAERGDVVLLNPGFRVDDHDDWSADVSPRVRTIADAGSPSRNLAVQSALIAGARAFIGTYGGYSYLAPLYRVPAVALYSRRTFKLQHLHAAQRAFAETGAAALLPVDIADAPLVRLALAAGSSQPAL